MFEAYKIGVRVSLINHVSTGLLAMGKDFARTHGEVTALERSIKSIQNTALKGGLMVGAAIGIGAMLKAPYEEAKKLAQAQADFNNLNLSALDNSRAFGTATNIAHKTLGTTITGNIKLIQDLHTATGDLNKSLGLSGAYSQFSVAARVQNGGNEVDGLVINSIKALEHRGDRLTQDPKALQNELNRQSQVFFATKGRVSPSDYFHMSQTGKMAYTLADADFLYGPMAAMIQSKTGATAGTAQMTTLSSLIGGHMTNKAKGFLRGMGLWEDQASPLTAGLKGSINSDPLVKKLVAAQGDVAIQSGGLPAWAASLAAGNTNAFMLQVLAPAIRKKYGNMSDEQVGLLLTKQFNRNTADDLSYWIMNQQKVAKDTGIINKSNGFSGAYKNYMKSPEGAEEAAGAAWKNFLAVFGSIYLPKITQGLLKLADVLIGLSESVAKHPAIWSALAYSLGAVAVGLGLRGGGLLLSAAIRGLGLALAFSSAGGVSGLLSIGAALLPFAPAIIAIGAAMWGIKWLIDWANKPDTLAQKKMKAFGKTADDHYNKFNNDGFHFPSLDTVKPSAKNGGGKQGDIYMDGKKVGEIVSGHQAKSAHKPFNGQSAFDMSMSPLPAGMRFAK